MQEKYEEILLQEKAEFEQYKKKHAQITDALQYEVDFFKGELARVQKNAMQALAEKAQG